MKKKLICFILLFTMLFPFASCKDEAAYKRLDELSAKIQALETENDTLNDKISELEAENQTQAGKITELEMLQNIYKTDGDRISIFNAYKTKRITKEDVVSILYHRNKASLEANKEAVGDSFVPKPKFPEMLPPFLETLIKTAVLEDYRAWHNLNLTMDNVHITGYYGSYFSSPSNDCFIAFDFSVDGIDGSGATILYKDGIHFPDCISIWFGKIKPI